MSMPLIEFKQVEYTYPAAQSAALKGVSFTINEGDYVAFVGTSGSGKSTLMSILGLINLPSKGEYLLNQVPVSNLTSSSIHAVKNQGIGFIFQDSQRCAE